MPIADSTHILTFHFSCKQRYILCLKTKVGKYVEPAPAVEQKKK